MTRRFRRCLIGVSIAHVLVVLLFMAIPGCRQLLRPKKNELVVPIEFLVEVPSEPAPAPPAPPAPKPPDPEPPAPEPPEPESVDPAPVPKPPKPPKPPIVPNRERITRRPTQPKPVQKPTLTPEEIERLLKMGAKPSDRTSIPDEDPRCLDLIKRAFYTAWTQPVAAPGLKTTVTFRLADGGAIVSWSMVGSSGSAEFDASVRGAADAVRRVDGLTPGFLGRYPSVTIAFTVE